MKKIQLTKQGFKNLQKEHRQLLDIKRPQAVDRLKKARGMGDLSENSEYSAAKEDLALIEGRIQEIEEILRQGQIVENHANSHLVDVGATVTVEIGGNKEQFSIVGEFEADPLNKKLSHTSPIGKALLGKKVGETIEIEVPAGRMVYKIIDIK